MKYKVNLNGKTYEVEVEKGQAIIADEYNSVNPLSVSAPAPEATPAAPPPTISSSAPAAGKNTVTSPIAGTVLSVLAKPGQTIKSGEPVLIIEAMKMENEIVAPKDGVIGTIYVEKGKNVANGDSLFDFN